MKFNKSKTRESRRIWGYSRASIAETNPPTQTEINKEKIQKIVESIVSMVRKSLQEDSENFVPNTNYLKVIK